MTKSQRNSLCKRIRGLGLSQHLTYQLINQMCFWMKHSGEEWTVQRVKSMKVDYIRYLAGKSPVGNYAKRPSGSPKGPFGALWGQDPKRSLSVLNLYSLLLSRKVTPSQWKKFHNSVTAVDRSDRSVCGQIAKVGHALLKHYSPETIRQTPCLERMVVSSKKRAPTGLRSRTVPEMDVLKTLRCFQTDMWQQFLDFRCVNEALGRLRSVLPIEDSEFDPRFGTKGYIGQIGFIQEPGYKLRAVANPHRILQLALKPLGDYLFSCIKSIPTDCTFDQEKGIRDTQEHLNKGGLCWSVDLSDATNNFPFSIQMKILEHFPYKDMLEVFRRASRGEWLCPTPDGPKNLRWTKGQPLGLYPSFPSFALAHHSLVHWCWLKWKDEDANAPPITECYRILGDDIVIYHEPLYLKYMEGLKSLDIPISPSKSMEASSVGEFAGRVITKTHTYVCPKWRNISDHSFVDLVRNFGPGAISILRPRQKRVMRWFAPLPESLGGLGFNPKGLSLDTRLGIAYNWIHRDIERHVEFGDSVTRVEKLLTRLSYEEGPSVLRHAPLRRVHRPDATTVKSRILRITNVVEELCNQSDSLPPEWISLSDPDPFRVSILSVLERFSPDCQTDDEEVDEMLLDQPTMG